MILVTGLPRSGSMSTAKALEILGYNVHFYCPLTKQGRDWTELSEINADVLVDWSVCGQLDIFCWSIKVEKIIFLTRNKGWLLSLDNLGASKLRTEYILDLQDGIRVAQSKRIPYITLDITNKPRWNDICKFVGRPIPEEKFPHLNRAEFNYKI